MDQNQISISSQDLRLVILARPEIVSEESLTQKTQELQNPPKLTEQLAYLAGYFDGEGCISFNAKKSTLQARIGSADKEILEKFKLLFGGEVKPTFYKTNAKRQMYIWGLHNKAVQEFILKILPWLNGKRDVARLALVPTFGEKYQKLADDEKLLRLRIENHIHSINQRVTSV